MLAGQLGVPGGHPGGEALRKDDGIESGKDAFKGVVGGNAVGQVHEALEPSASFLTKQSDLLEILGREREMGEGVRQFTDSELVSKFE